MYERVNRAIKSSTVTNWFGNTGSKQVSSSDIAPMAIEDIQSECTEHSCMEMYHKHENKSGISECNNILAFRNLMHPWE